MKIVEQGKTVRITELTNQEIRGLIKCNVKLKLIAYDMDGDVVDFIYLLDRLETKEILISKQKDGRAAKPVRYSDVADLIELVIRHGVGGYEIAISKDHYYQKKQVIDLIPNLKKEIVDGLVSLDYKKNIFICKFDDGTGFIMSIYYWILTDDFYMFTKEGPIWAYYNPAVSKIKSFEQLVCN